jgi:hypothetical protein
VYLEQNSVGWWYVLKHVASNELDVVAGWCAGDHMWEV